MKHGGTAIDHPKRRRRRRVDRTPISGWLGPSEHFKGNVGRISHALFADLFHHHVPSDQVLSDIHYVAVTPWSPLSKALVEDAVWTILPVQAHKDVGEGAEKLGPSSIHFPSTSPALESFAETLHGEVAVKSKGGGIQGSEVRILDVEPLRLETIYITVDGDSLKEHEEVQKKFGGGFDYTQTNGAVGKGKGKAKCTPSYNTRSDGGQTQVRERSDQLISTIRSALAPTIIVRQNSSLQLPLPTHPITHVALPPARISLCEPVSQGLLTDLTKIIVNRVFRDGSVSRSSTARKTVMGEALGDGYDTSNESFFSATEKQERKSGRDSEMSNSALGSEQSDTDTEDSSDDDSVQNLISMNAANLPNHSARNLSSLFVATPRVGGSQRNGTSTPGSVFSNCTAVTARHSSRPVGKPLKAKGLMSRIPDEMLFPKPSFEEDEEARVFVDTKVLLKLGCFSGDWVQLETAPAPDSSHSGLWSVNAFGNGDMPTEMRPAKVYGLSGLSQTTVPRYRKGDPTSRRSSIATVTGQDSPNLVAWLSPILLANLRNTSYVKLTPLMAKIPENPSSRTVAKTHKIEASDSPPTARELTILRISSPTSTERALQTGIFTALKQYFEKKRRILKQRDIIALQVDTRTSRLMAQPVSSLETEPDTEDLLALPPDPESSAANSLDIAWFRVGQITMPENENQSYSPSPDTWGGAACVEPTVTRMRQAGSELSKIPSSSNSSSEHYLGLKPPLRAESQLNAATGLDVASMSPRQVAPLRRRLRELLAAATSPRAINFRMNPMVILLHSTQRNIGKAALASGAASDTGLHVFDIDAYDLLAEGGSASDVKTEATFKARAERALSCGPSCTALLIRHIEALTSDRMVTALKETISDVRVLIATTTEIENVPDEMRSLFTHELEVSAPDEGERESILRAITEDRAIRLAHDVDLSSIAVKSAALVAGDIVDIVERAIVARQDRLEQIVFNSSSGNEETQKMLVRDVVVAGGENVRSITKADFDIAVEAARKNFADAIGAPKIPNVSWDDVGGLENVKDAVVETIQLPLERPELFAKGMKKRSGILFYGPPGTGKTLLAKAIATEFSLNFFSVKGPELLNMYIGESEANVRRVFQRARDARPCVVFFDELDSVAPKRGNQGDSGGVMDRIVSQLLAELDGMSDGDEGAGGVFVIGATNRPDLLDQALLRPGRFDKMLYLGISDTHKKQQTILEALTRKFTMHPAMSLQRVAESLPFTYTGADLYALCSDAMLKAITRQASAVDAKIKALPGGPVTTAYFFDHLATENDIAVMVTEEDFFAAQRELVGSVRYFTPTIIPPSMH